MTYSLFDLYNELNYVQLQVQDDLANQREVTAHDITLCVNGVEVKLPTTADVVDVLKKAVSNTTALPPDKFDDDDYLRQLKEFRRDLTRKVFDAIMADKVDALPHIHIVIGEQTQTMNLNANTFNGIDDLILDEIRYRE